MAEDTPGGYVVRRVAISKIAVREQALRVDPESDAIIELANDIALRGLLQPIGVSEDADGQYQLLWGGRRLAAHKRLDRDTIIAHIYDLQDTPVKAIALVENLQREQLTLGEEVEAVEYLHGEEKKSVDQISALLSKSRSWVLNRLSVRTLPDYLREPLFEGHLNYRQVEQIMRFDDDGCRRYLASRADQERLSSSVVKQLGESYMAYQPQAPGTPPSPITIGSGLSRSAYQYRCEVCEAPGESYDFALVRVCASCNAQLLEVKREVAEQRAAAGGASEAPLGDVEGQLSPDPGTGGKDGR